MTAIDIAAGRQSAFVPVRAVNARLRAVRHGQRSRLFGLEGVSYHLPTLAAAEVPWQCA
jgi:hypothetical protein